jgi:hypothetical protein
MTQQSSNPSRGDPAPGKGKADDTDRITFLSIVLSVLAAAFGVQNRRNRERDFTKGNIYVFAIAGVVFTALFVAVLYGVVLLILP